MKHLKFFNKRSWMVLLTLVYIITFLSDLTYISFFHDSLSNSEYKNIQGFTRIITPDTFLYKNIINTDNAIISIISSSIKNTIGPSLIWYIGQLNWYYVSLINIIIIIILVSYVKKLFLFYNISFAYRQLGIMTILLIPSTFFYSLGALKELPMALLLVVIFYNYVKKNYLYVIIFTMILFIFRYQMIIILLFLYLGTIFKSKQYFYFLFGMFITMSLYPSLAQFNILSTLTVELYREEYGVKDSIGAIIENIRNSVYIFSTFAILIRTVQSLFEPILTFVSNFNLFENGYFAVYQFQQLVTNFIMIPYFWLFLKKLLFIIKRRSLINNNIQTLYLLLLTLIILIGGFSFIHNRYLYPLFPLLIVASLIPKNIMLKPVSSNKGCK